MPVNQLVPSDFFDLMAQFPNSFMARSNAECSEFFDTSIFKATLHRGLTVYDTECREPIGTAYLSVRSLSKHVETSLHTKFVWQTRKSGGEAVCEDLWRNAVFRLDMTALKGQETSQQLENGVDQVSRILEDLAERSFGSILAKAPLCPPAGNLLILEDTDRQNGSSTSNISLPIQSVDHEDCWGEIPHTITFSQDRILEVDLPRAGANGMTQSGAIDGTSYVSMRIVPRILAMSDGSLRICTTESNLAHSEAVVGNFERAIIQHLQRQSQENNFLEDIRCLVARGDIGVAVSTLYKEVDRAAQALQTRVCWTGAKVRHSTDIDDLRRGMI